MSRISVCVRIKYFFAKAFTIFGHEKIAIKQLTFCQNDNADLRKVILEMQENIDQLTQYVNEEKSRSIKDALTGLYNRRFLDEAGIQIIANQKRIKQSWGTLYIDIDLFKSINDKYGHATGDEVLQKIAKLLKKYARKGDFIIRNGGDEFIIIAPNLKKEDDLVILANRLVGFIGKAFADSFSITVSIGCCFVKKDSKKNLMDAIDFSDQALYIAKNRGRNQVFQCKKEI